MDGGGEPQLLDLLGDGGSSQVWRAVDAAGRIVALKMLKPELRRRSGARACLQREHDLLRELAHPRVVETLGFIEHRGVPAIVLEHLGGGDLMSLAGAAPRHWLAAARDVVAALEHLHARGFVHRDVKARNVLFDAEHNARLIDFASMLPIGASAQSAGATAAHRPPGSKPGPAAICDDVYAFAVLLYQLLVGRLPYGRKPSAELAGTVPVPPLGAGVARSTGRLAALVIAALAASGEVSGGLSAFRDVIESAVATYR
jgi:serine/threonine protein kinase